MSDRQKEPIKLLPAKAGTGMAATQSAQSTTAPAAPKREPWFLSHWLIGGVALVFAAGFGTAAVFASVKASAGDTVLPRVRVAGIDVGGMTRAEARATLDQRATDFSKQTFVFRFTDDKGKARTFKASLEELGLVIDVGGTVDVAFGVGHRADYLGSLAGQLVSALGGTDADVVVRGDTTTLASYLGTAFLKIEQPARDARLSYADGSLKVVEAKNGHEVDRSPLTTALLAQTARLNHTDLTLALVETQPFVTADELAPTKELASRILRRSINLYYKDKTFTPSKDVVGGWFEFQTLQPDGLLGQAAGFSTAALLVTPTEQERRGEKAGDPYYVLLPPENVAGGAPSAPIAVVGFNRSKLQNWLHDTVSSELDQPGQDARFAFVNGQIKVTKPSTIGTGVDLDKALVDVVNGVGADSTTNTTADSTKGLGIKLALHQTKPAITEDKINELGITTLIGRGVTDASGSSGNRLVNIDTGLSKYDGVVIAPKQTFSTVGTLGPVDAASGFLPELVISGNKIEPQYGGGLCQVSSTLYRAVLDTGLPVTERTNHAFVVSHYVWPYNAPGYEATIFEPKPDLAFVNDTKGYILIHAYRQTKDDKVVFEFYGTDPHRTTAPSQPYWIYGGPVGGGQTEFTYKVTDDATGKVFQNQEVISTFEPLAKFKLTR